MELNGCSNARPENLRRTMPLLRSLRAGWTMALQRFAKADFWRGENPNLLAALCHCSAAGALFISRQRSEPICATNHETPKAPWCCETTAIPPVLNQLLLVETPFTPARTLQVWKTALAPPR
jgi:hypothetical protein